MALKFRRGTTAQQSGSLAFGEPFVNTTLGTLLVGGATGDIVLATTGTGSVGTFGAISGSGLDITGNANIAGNLTLGGNITIGDNTSDTVNVTANLSSSLIPSQTDAFDLGSASKIWRDLYISTGSIKFTDAAGNVVRTFSPSTLTALESATGSSDISITNINSTTASLNTSVNNLNSTTASLLIETANLESFTSSINTTIKSKLDADGVISGSSQITLSSTTGFSAYSTSVDSRITTEKDRVDAILLAADADKDSFAEIVTLINSVDTTNDSAFASFYTSSVNRLNNLESTSASVNVSISNINSYTASNDSTNTTQNTRLTALEASASTALSTNNTQDTSITNLNSTTASLNTSVSNLNSFSSSQLSKDDTLASLTASYDGRWTTLATTTGSINTSLSNLNTTTASLLVETANLETFTASLSTTSNVRFGSLGIGMAATGTAGRIDAANDIVAFSTSDIRFKENITPIENAIEKIRKISGNTYDWKEELKDLHGYEGNDVGVIAQEIEAVLPQLVQNRDNGYKAVKYDKLVALLIEGIKEQQLQIEQLRIDLNNCKNNTGL